MIENYNSIKQLLYNRLDEINTHLSDFLKSNELLSRDKTITLIEDDKYFIERLINILSKQKDSNYKERS